MDFTKSVDLTKSIEAQTKNHALINQAAQEHFARKYTFAAELIKDGFGGFFY